MKYLGAMLIALLMPFAAANATLTTVDSSVGPATAVLDTNTGLEWLKFSVTRNMSINQVFAAMEPGGSLEGFRYSKGSEFPSGVRFEIGSSDVATVQAFFALFGIETLFPGPDPNPVVTFSNVDPPGGLNVREGILRTFALVVPELPGAVPYVEFDSQIIPVSSRLNEPALHWLVAEAQAVPEPSTLALLVLGALALAKRRLGRGEKRLKN
jgi:hypothetical protein